MEEHRVQEEANMATKIEHKLPNGQTEVFYKIEGMTFVDAMVKKLMAAKDLDLQMKWVKETPIRDDDVIICAFPKQVGTHWTWEIVNMIQRGAAEYQKTTKVAAMLEYSSPEMTEAMTSPRVLNTHLTHSLIPVGIKQKKSKILHVMRNPKDVLVSMYFHIKAEKSLECPPFDVFKRMFWEAFGEPLFCSYMWYIKQWQQFQEENPDHPLLNVYYEDIKMDPEGQIKKIAQFLGKDIDDALVKGISAKCDFQNMKKAHVDKQDVMEDRIGHGTAFVYRKGGIGDWKNHLTVADSEEMDVWIDSNLKDTDIKFQYE